MMLDFLLKYSHILVFGSVYYAMLDADDVGDYVIISYEFWVVIMLMVIKIGLQIDYKCGNPYDEEKEIIEIEKFERTKYMIYFFGKDLARIIAEMTGDFKVDDCRHAPSSGCWRGCKRSRSKQHKKSESLMKQERNHIFI